MQHPSNEINSGNFSQSLYESSIDVLLTANVPGELAEIASHIVASDDPALPDWGRTPADQEVIRQVTEILNQGRRDEH